MRIRPAALLVCFLIAASAAAQGHYRFHASAYAIAGDFGYGAIAPQASVVLPENGGDVEARATAFDQNGVRFDEAVSRVHGFMDGTTAVTEIAVTIRNLDIRGLLHADEVRTFIHERHRAGAEETEITFDGSGFNNLIVGDTPLDLDLDEQTFSNRPTYRAFVRGAREGRREEMTPATGEPVTASLVRDAMRNGIHVDGLGTMFVGEVIVKPGMRHLTMFRYEPDAQSRTFQVVPQPKKPPATQGGGGVGSVEGNGTYTVP